MRLLIVSLVVASMAGCGTNGTGDAASGLFTAHGGAVECIGAATQTQDPAGHGADCRFDGLRMGPVTCEWVFVRIERDVVGRWQIARIEGLSCS